MIALGTPTVTKHIHKATVTRVFHAYAVRQHLKKMKSESLAGGGRLCSESRGNCSVDVAAAVVVRCC